MVDKLSSSERAVLEYFFDHPREDIHVRGLAEELDVSYSSVRNALEKLYDLDLLERDQRSKMTFYSAAGSKKFREEKKLYNLRKLNETGVVEIIEEELRPDAVVLFGSFLEGRDHEGSDIDIAIIDPIDKNIDLSRAEKDLKRGIDIIRVGKLEKESNEFRNTLANGHVLSGYLELV